MIAEDKIIQLIDRFQFIEAKMSGDVAGSDIAALAKEYSELKPVVETVSAYKDIVTQIAEAEAMRTARRACERSDARQTQIEAELDMLGALTVQPRPNPEDGQVPRPSPMETRLALVQFADGLSARLHAELAALTITLTQQRATLAAMVDQARRASSAQRGLNSSGKAGELGATRPQTRQ